MFLLLGCPDLIDALLVFREFFYCSPYFLPNTYSALQCSSKYMQVLFNVIFKLFYSKQVFLCVSLPPSILCFSYLTNNHSFLAGSVIFFYAFHTDTTDYCRYQDGVCRAKHLARRGNSWLNHNSPVYYRESGSPIRDVLIELTRLCHRPEPIQPRV